MVAQIRRPQVQVLEIDFLGGAVGHFDEEAAGLVWLALREGFLLHLVLSCQNLR
jgi:hypothetical protein